MSEYYDGGDRKKIVIEDKEKESVEATWRGCNRIDRRR